MMRLLAAIADRICYNKKTITTYGIEPPYLTRWTLREFGDGGKLYLHHFQRSDPDEMHDHPWGFCSLILSGGYYEKTPGSGWSGGLDPVCCRWYGAGRLLRRSADFVHSVVIPPGRFAWTLVYRGPKYREWGFFCPRRFVGAARYFVRTDRGKPGCD
jgi:hypothetical protein